MTDYIKIEDLKDGYLYEIDGRNASLGVWAADKYCFFVSRTKFGDNFLSIESHYDDDPPYGTAKPLKEVERVPFWGIYITEDAILTYLNGEWNDKEDLTIENTSFGNIYALCPDNPGKIYFGGKKK